jgi:UDP-2-acetamido-3-amino-2,3-dideoxy-glucuronate N-acetyltransferase
MSKSAPFIHERALVETTDIGEGTRVWAFAHVMPNVKLGKGCNIGDHAFVESHVTLGDNVTVKNGVSIWQHVHVGDNVFIGPNAVFTNDRFPRSRSSDWAPEDTRLEEGVTIGANATIVCGITLGRRCFIGAGSVVTCDVPPHALVFGNPARHHGWVCFCAQPLSPDGKGMAICTKCQRAYEVTANGVTERAKV